MPHPTEEQIRTRAHQLWELAGQPEGREDEFWREAERELKDGATNNPDEVRDVHRVALVGTT
jgi:hypothetical protein